VFDGCIQRQWLQAAWSVPSVVRTSLPNLRVVIFPGIGAYSIFLGEPEQTMTQSRIGGVAGEPAATLGLFAAMKEAPSTHSQPRRESTSGSRSPAPLG